MNLNIFDLELMKLCASNATIKFENYQNILEIDVTIKSYQHAFLFKCKFE